MADINHVILVGRLTRDAELKYTNSGYAVGKFSVAINTRRKRGDEWVEEANFFDVVVWGKVAEALNPYLVKGKQVGVEGQLRQNRWEQDGQPRSKVEIVSSNIQLLGSKMSPQTQDNSSGGEPFPSASSGDTYGNTFAKPSDSKESEAFEDDIPF